MRVAVIGGGIAGLAAAWELRDRAEVTVFEPGRLGGKILTSDFAGRPVDEGPDSFITRVPAGLELCRELGLEPALVAPAAGRTLLWAGGRLRRLPDGLVLGVPKHLGTVARSRLLTPVGMARAGLDLVLPPTRPAADVSVGELVRRRFGSEVADRLVEPLVGGIHAAPIDGLSAEATVPHLVAAARRSRSLLLGLRSQPAAPADGPPMFLAPLGGMAVLVEVLVAALERAGVTFAAEAVRAVDPVGGGHVGLGELGDFGGAVLATPAHDAARLLAAAPPAGLAGLSRTTVTLVTLAYAASDLTLPDGANGVLVPRAEGRLMTACSFGSNKWPHWAATGRVVLRLSVGRRDTQDSARLPDATLVERLSAEVRSAFRTRAEPTEARISRWPDGLPYYRVGHPATMAAIRAELGRRAPRVALAGSSYSGAGIPACIASGREAARAVLAASR